MAGDEAASTAAAAAAGSGTPDARAAVSCACDGSDGQGLLDLVTERPHAYETPTTAASETLDACTTRVSCRSAASRKAHHRRRAHTLRRRRRLLRLLLRLLLAGAVACRGWRRLGGGGGGGGVAAARGGVDGVQSRGVARQHGAQLGISRHLETEGGAAVAARVGEEPPVQQVVEAAGQLSEAEREADELPNELGEGA